MLRPRSRRSLLIARRAVIVICALSVGEGRANAFGSDGARSVATIYDELASMLSRIMSVEYEAEAVLVNHAPGAANERAWRTTFAMQGNLFRARVEGADPEHPYSHEAAFDGQTYQFFRDGVLGSTANPRTQFNTQYLSVQPIIVPLRIFFQDEESSEFTTLLNEELWTRLASHSTYVRSDRVNGDACDVVAIEQITPSRELRVTAFLSRALESYPVRVSAEAVMLQVPEESPLRRLSREMSVDAVAYKTEAGRVVLPMVIELLDYDSNKSLMRTQTYQILRDSLRINRPMDTSRFRIEEGQATVVLNEDKRTRRMAGGEAELGQGEAGLWRGLLIASPLIIAAAVLIFLLRRKG